MRDERMAPIPQAMKLHNLQPKRETSKNIQDKTTWKGVFSSPNKVKVWDDKKHKLVNVIILVLIGDFERRLVVFKSFDGGRIVQIRKTRRFIQNLGGDLYF